LDTEKHANEQLRDEAIASAPNVSTLRQTHLSTAAAGAALMAFAAPHPAADALPLTHQEAPERVRHEAPQPVRKAAPQKQARGATKVRQDIAMALLQRGAALEPSNRAIAAQLKVSPSTVDRIAKAMTPLQGAAA
jgi:DNA-binding NarL/FixJ family response regulator